MLAIQLQLDRYATGLSQDPRVCMRTPLGNASGLIHIQVKFLSNVCEVQSWGRIFFKASKALCSVSVHSKGYIPLGLDTQQMAYSLQHPQECPHLLFCFGF